MGQHGPASQSKDAGRMGDVPDMPTPTQTPQTGVISILTRVEDGDESVRRRRDSEC